MLDGLYNFIVEQLFIWAHLETEKAVQSFIFTFKIIFKILNYRMETCSILKLYV